VRNSIVVAFALLLVGQAPSYRIHVAVNPAVGQTQIYSTEGRSKETTSVEGKTKTTLVTDRVEATETMVRRTDSSATLRLQYTKSERETDRGRQADSAQGKTFTVTVRGDKIGILSSDGQPLSESNRAAMTHQIQSLMRLEANNVCIPTGPLTIGSTWNIPAESAGDCLANFSGAVFSQSTGRLSAVDQDTATIDYRFALRLKNLGPLEFDAPVQVYGTMKLRISLADPIDWTTTTTWHLKGTAHPRGPSAPSLFAEVTRTETGRSSPGK
jgi:hypothetical protein